MEHKTLARIAVTPQILRRFGKLAEKRKLTHWKLMEEILDLLEDNAVFAIGDFLEIKPKKLRNVIVENISIDESNFY